jgi:hypothetical protein
MTEDQWLTCTNPKEMLAFLADRRRASERKLRLFSCACCRRVWHALTDERARKAVEVAERYADGAAGEEEREEALAATANARHFGVGAVRWAVVAMARTGAVMAVDVAGQTAACPPGQEYDPALWEAEWRGQCDLLRDLFGPLPFRPVAIDASWRTPNILTIAQAICDERATTRMLELAQAMYQAGCKHRDILHHCLWSANHARGCWVIDLILVKQ